MAVTFGHVGPPSWARWPVFVVGGGPSLEGRDLSGLHERGFVLGVNRAADYVRVHATFSLDYNFMRKRAASLREWALTHEVFLAVAPDYPEDQIPGATYLERIQGKGVATDPRKIVNGLNSGYGALNLSVLKGSREVYLLGFDMHPTGEGPTHWHDGYDWHSRRTEIYFERWAARFREARDTLPPTMRVYNANPQSAIDAFPFVEWEDLP